MMASSWWWLYSAILIVAVRIAAASIPTTLEGPFQPVTVKFDPSLRQGSSDLSQDDPRIVKQVSGNFPEQISLALSTPDAMWITWITGNAQLAPEVTPLDPTTVASVVQYGTTSGNYDLSAVGTSLVYSQLYPFPGLLNYTSGIIHHVRLTGEDFVPCNVQRVLSTWIYIISILVKPISQLSLEPWKCFGCFQCIILCVAL
jgi:hypothetical protein